MSTFQVGQEFPERIFPINRALLVQYANASGDQNPIHQDEQFAKSVGLPDVIAHGMLTMALAGKYVSDIAGASTKVRAFSARFTKPLVVPADHDVSLQVSAVVAEILDDGAIRLDISAVCDGVKVLGQAKAIITP